MYVQECVEVRRVRTHPRWNAGVRAEGVKPGSNARVWRSLDVDEHANVEAAERGQHDNSNEEDSHDGRSGEVWRRRSS
jgi:hypothetical protein